MADTPNKEDELRGKLEGPDNELYGTDAWRNEDKQMYVFANNPEAHCMLHTFKQLIREKGEDEGLIAIVNGIQTRENPLKEDLKVVDKEDESMLRESPEDEELRENILTEFKQVLKLAPIDYTENCTNVVMSLIKSRDQRIALAYGGCTNCYGKGYATYSGEYSARGMKWPDKPIKYCDCERGKQLEKVNERIALEAQKKHEGIGAYCAASSLLQNVGYLLAHRSQGGLPPMTAEVIGNLYDELKKILDENKKSMEPEVTLKAQKEEQV